MKTPKVLLFHLTFSIFSVAILAKQKNEDDIIPAVISLPTLFLPKTAQEREGTGEGERRHTDVEKG